MSGYGAGIEDLNVGIGKMAVAFLNGARPDIVTQNGNLAKSNIDVRLYDLKGPAGLLGVVVRLRYCEGRHGSPRARSFPPQMDTPSGCATSAWSGTAAITRFPSGTEREPPAISAPGNGVTFPIQRRISIVRRASH